MILAKAMTAGLNNIYLHTESIACVKLMHERGC